MYNVMLSRVELQKNKWKVYLCILCDLNLFINFCHRLIVPVEDRAYHRTIEGCCKQASLAGSHQNGAWTKSLGYDVRRG